MKDELYLKLIWSRRELGYPLDLRNPKSFNEKMQWLKLHDHNPDYSRYVDKYAVKKIVSDIIGANHVIPLIAGPWENADDIEFDKLPESFVLKCNHDSGGVIICTDKSKLDYERIKKMLNKRLSHNYFWDGREWPYKNVKPCIFAEKYVLDESGYELKDYKVFCFSGNPKIIQVDYDRFSDHHRNLYDSEWNYLPYTTLFPNDSNHMIKKPNCLGDLLEYSSMLSKGIPFVRVDFYIVKDTVYFGEMTFYHGGGHEDFRPLEWDYKLGEMVKLPNQKAL